MTTAISLDCTFQGTSQDWAALADMVGTSTDDLGTDGMQPHIAAFVARERGDPLLHANMQTTRTMWAGNEQTLERHSVCPTAYALARYAGYDPAAILLLETVKCDVAVSLPGWPDQLKMNRGDTDDDVCGPVAPGMLWMQDPLNDEPRIMVHPVGTGLPETLLIVLRERLTERPLRDLISHPLLDPLDLRVERVQMQGDEISWILEITGAPGAVPLREAARVLETGGTTWR